MKHATLLALCIALGQICFARSASSLNPLKDTVQSNTPSLSEMLKEILSITGTSGDFELKEANVLNIEAFISHRKRYILYNRSFIERLNSLTKDKWATMALLAHEVGHHLNGHTIRKGGSRPDVELEADEFAGFVLHKLGATLDQSQIVMHYIAKAEASKTHPSKNSRMTAIEKGWNRSANTTSPTETGVR